MAQRKPYNTIAATTPSLSSITNNILTQNATTNFIGLNKTNPISQLDVVGDIRAYTANNTSGVLLSSSGGVYASSKLVLGADLATLGTGVDSIAGGKLEMKTRTDGEFVSTPKLTVNNQGSLGFGNATPVLDGNGNTIGVGPSYGNTGQILTSQGENNMPIWSLPSTFASRGFFRVDITRSSSVGQRVNINSLAANATPVGMSLDALPLGNNIQFIRLTAEATYIMNWNINLHQTGGSAGLLQFNIFVGGAFSQFQQLYLNGGQPTSGSFIFTTTTPNTTLNIDVYNQSSVAFNVTGNNSLAYSQISILKI